MFEGQFIQCSFGFICLRVPPPSPKYKETEWDCGAHSTVELNKKIK